MNVKEAVKNAKVYVIDLFSEENLTNVGLEEVEYDDQSGEWVVTIGFSRPWDRSMNTMAIIAGNDNPRRAYKVVRLNNTSGEVSSVKNRETS